MHGQFSSVVSRVDRPTGARPAPLSGTVKKAGSVRLESGYHGKEQNKNIGGGFFMVFHGRPVFG